jgi:hypothetical protein
MLARGKLGDARLFDALALDVPSRIWEDLGFGGPRFAFSKVNLSWNEKMMHPTGLRHLYIFPIFFLVFKFIIIHEWRNVSPSAMLFAYLQSPGCSGIS